MSQGGVSVNEYEAYHHLEFLYHALRFAGGKFVKFFRLVLTESLMK